MKPLNLSGIRFSRLVVLYRIPKGMWRCQCDCGKQHNVRTSHLTTGQIQSCGCLGVQRRSEACREQFSIDIKDRFWAKVAKTENCWNWIGRVDRDGYGRINEGGRHGKRVMAHRLSYQWAHGDIPEGMMVCHHCDTPKCVNPSHLFLGTAKDNTQDAIRKGRMAAGEANPKAKLTVAKALLIRELWIQAPMSRGGKRKKNGTASRIASHVGVPVTSVRDVIYGKSWQQEFN